MTSPKGGKFCMFVVVVFLEARSSRLEALRQALLQHASNSLEREDGCQRYDVCLDPVEAPAFLLYEVYSDEAAYQAHRELPHYAEFRVLTDPWIRSRRVLTYEMITGSGSA
jgi:autoinducer 2-degrading protein